MCSNSVVLLEELTFILLHTCSETLTNETTCNILGDLRPSGWRPGRLHVVRIDFCGLLCPMCRYGGMRWRSLCLEKVVGSICDPCRSLIVATSAYWRFPTCAKSPYEIFAAFCHQLFGCRVRGKFIKEFWGEFLIPRCKQKPPHRKRKRHD